MQEFFKIQFENFIFHFENFKKKGAFAPISTLIGSF